MSVWGGVLDKLWAHVTKSVLKLDWWCWRKWNSDAYQLQTMWNHTKCRENFANTLGPPSSPHVLGSVLRVFLKWAFFDKDRLTWSYLIFSSCKVLKYSDPLGPNGWHHGGPSLVFLWANSKQQEPFPPTEEEQSTVCCATLSIRPSAHCTMQWWHWLFQ